MSDENPEREGLEVELARERAARLAAEREVAELQAQKRHLESRAIAARQTLAYGLGRAIIEARSLKGILALPSRIRTLRLRQKAKRKLRVPDTVPGDVAQRMRLVDETLETAARDGVAAAAKSLDRISDSAMRGRALAELALYAIEAAPELLPELALRSARTSPAEPRLLTLIARLQDTGAVTLPARIGAAVAEVQSLSEEQRRWLASLSRDAEMLAGGRSPTASERGAAQSQGPVSRLALLAPERWHNHPRILAAAAAARKAGLEVAIGAKPAGEKEAVHILPDSLDFAERMIEASHSAARVMLDIANRPAELEFGAESEAGQVAGLRLERILTAADTVITRGPAAAQLAEAKGHAPDRLSDVWPGATACSAEDVAIARAEFGLGLGPALAVIADLTDENGIDALFPAFEALRREGAAEQLAVLGTGPGAPRLSSIAAEYGLEEAVLFLGMPDFPRWPALFSCFDAALFPGIRPESMGSTVPLAMVLAAQLGIPALYSEAAWQSRTNDSLVRNLFGADRKGDIARLLDPDRRQPPLEPAAGPENLYAGLRKG